MLLNTVINAHENVTAISMNKSIVITNEDRLFKEIFASEMQFDKMMQQTNLQFIFI